jgi:hypothetical protein
MKQAIRAVNSIARTCENSGAFGLMLSLKVSGEIRRFSPAVDANHIEEKQFPLINSYLENRIR